MKRRKVLAALVVLAIIATLFLSACNNNSSTESPASPNTAESPASPGSPGSPGEVSNLSAQIAQSALDYVALVRSEIKAGAASSKDTLTFAAVTDPGRIDTGSLRDLLFYPLSTAAQQYFMLFDPELGRYFSPVCDSFDVDPDDMGVTFHITPGIKMPDGNTFGATDIITSIEAFRTHNGLGWQLDFVDLDSAEITDEYTLHLRFNRLNGVWGSSFEMLTVISGKAYEAAGGDISFYQAPVCPGPYYISEWASGDHITLTRFDDYFLGTPPIKTITMKIISDRTAAFMALQNGEIDLLWNISADQVKTAYSNDALQLLMTGKNMSIFLGMNSGNKALSDLRVREAIFRTVNRDDIIKGAYDGLATPAASIITPEGLGYNSVYDTNSPFPPLDLDKAKSLMAEAGYGSGLTLRVLAESTINFQLVVEQLAAQLGEIGITLEPTLTDNASLSAILFGTDTSAYDLFLYVAKAAGEPVSTVDNPMLFGASHPELSADGSGAEYAELWQKVRSTPDTDQRTEAYKDVQAFFFEKGLYWIPLAISQTYIGLNKDLTGIRIIGFQGFFGQAYFR